MRSRTTRLPEICSLLVATLGATAGPADADPLVLAENGRTKYSIVISKDAVADGGEDSSAQEYTAKELAWFLNQMTGAEFAVKRDDTPASEFEIVLGRTNRMSLEEVPARLKPGAWEGFVIVRDGAKLLIMGNIPRATLYGVYDLLELELGCRFLAPKVNHVPRRPTLSVDVNSRKYDPPLEYRHLHYKPGHVWLVRHRFNSCGQPAQDPYYMPMEMKLGGVKWISKYGWVHSLQHMISYEEYFPTHPEYFALRDGKRVRSAPRSYGARVAETATQLCMTNPEVYKIVLEKVREAVATYKRRPSNRHTRFLVSVSEQDNGPICQCDECNRVNADEGSPTGGGTLIRFVNRIAREIGKEHPDVGIVTLAYQMMASPTKTRPEPNVVIHWARWVHNGKPLDGEENQKDDPRQFGLYQELRAWSKVTDRIYHWGYHMEYRDHMAPIGGLDHIGHNIRVMLKHGVTGVFAQTATDRGAELQQLRSYVLAKCIWRPQTDARQAAEEFCNLYYGKGAEQVLEYVRMLETRYRDARWYMRYYDLGDSFISDGDKIFTQAEKLAETDEQKHRVAVARLPIWKLMLTRGIGRPREAGAPVPPDLLKAGRRFLEVRAKEWSAAGKEKDFTNDFYRKVEAFLESES